MKLPRTRALMLACGASLLLAGGLALAQQPPQPPPGAAAPPTRPFPPNHPGVPGFPAGGRGQPPGGGHPPMILGPDGRPQGVPPGMRPRPGRPGQPGSKPFPTRTHAAQEEEEHGHGGGEHFCPGHGPEDPPPAINYWQGMLMVNNERAVKDDFLDRLLFRYENPKNPCDEKNKPPPLLASLLNFCILAYILARFGRKPLAEALVKRKQAIMFQIDEADRLYDDAEGRLDDYEEKLENIEAKLEEVRAEYAAQAEVEKKHILAEAEDRRVRMRRDAEFRIEQERKAVRDALLAEAVAAATVAAEALIQKQISGADHDRMATDYLASVGAALSRGTEPRPGTTGART